MPTALLIGPYRLFFYSSDADEPEHIHIDRDENVAKFWLEPVRLENSGGFNRTELRVIEKIVRDNQEQLLEAWHAYFKN